jgi:cytoskeletal protein CcmA (bactofilin family)
MFKRGKQKQGGSIDTLIGAGTRIIGDVRFTGGFHLDGHIKGNVDAPAQSGARPSVSDGAVVEGGVAVPNVVLNGTVKGDILAHERVELGATARVHGNVYYGLIEMAMGAEINGKLIHEPGRSAPVTAASAPAAEGVAPSGGSKSSGAGESTSS